MSTQFTATVKPSGGDYTSLSNAVNGLANNITAADIKVFSILASTTPTIAAGDTVLGQSSGATGVCVLVNASRTQILIKTIAVASFLYGEIVQKTAVPATNVTLSNTGDSPIIGIECYSMLDTTQVTISAIWITGINNYLYIYTPRSERHDGKWNNTKYRLEVLNESCIGVYTAFVYIDGLQIQLTSIDNSYKNAISNAHLISNCIIKGVISGTSQYCRGIWAINTTTIAYNNIIYDFINATTIEYGLHNPSDTLYAYNNTIYNCYYGFSQDNTGVFVPKNNLSYNNYYNYYGLFNTNSTNNLSGPAQANAPGVNPRQNQTVIFVSEMDDDFHLAPSDNGARNYGVADPGTGLFSDDIDGQMRPNTTWDIGADQASSCSSIEIQFTVI